MKLVLIGFFITLSLQANAMRVKSTEEFITQYTQKMNDRLEVTNLERALEGNRTYCSQLSDEQLNEIESLFVTNPTGKANHVTYRGLQQISASQFVSAVTENLACYPTTWIPGLSIFSGFFTNSKAYVMDRLLVKRTLEDLAGRPFEDSETLAQLVSR